MSRLTLVGEKEEFPGVMLYVDKYGIEKIYAYAVIGKGATAIAYKGVRISGDREEACIIKEYFPELEGENYCSKLVYTRDKVGNPVKIVVKDDRKTPEEKERLIEEEKKRQEQKIKMECEIVRRMYFDGEDNNPYIKKAEILPRMENRGDTLYVVLDTAKGQTLHSLIREQGRFSIEVAVDYLEKLLEIIHTLLGEKFLHGDIKPENIWLQGNVPNQQMVLLDFGSAFAYQDYQVEIKKPEGLRAWADGLLENTGIGTYSEGYESLLIKQFADAKENYANEDGDDEEGCTKRAEALLKIMNQLNISVDIFSAVQMFFYMITGTIYTEEVVREELIRELNLSELVIDYLLEMMMKNQDNYYTSVDKVKEDLRVLQTLYVKGAHPKVLIQNLRQSMLKSMEIDTVLLGEVKKG